MYDMGNRDGFGMMWVEDGRVRVEKSVDYSSTLMKLYEARMNNDIAVHVRNQTYGGKDISNAHPYCVLDMDMGHKIDAYVMHNGTIREVQVDKDMSDSYNFATKFLRPLLAKGNNYKLLHDEDFQKFLSGIIGPSKLVFLDNSDPKKHPGGIFTIINSDMGSYHQSGCWVSTKSEIKIQTPTYSPVYPTVRPSTVNVWDFEKGEWVADKDLRLHFTPEQVKPQSKNVSERADATITDQEELVGDDSSTQLEDDIDEEGLEEVLRGIPAMKKVDVYNFVVDYHSQTVAMLTKIDPKRDMKDFKKMVKSDPWEASNLLIKAAQDKYGTDKSSLN